MWDVHVRGEKFMASFNFLCFVSLFKSFGLAGKNLASNGRLIAATEYRTEYRPMVNDELNWISMRKPLKDAFESQRHEIIGNAVWNKKSIHKKPVIEQKLEILQEYTQRPYFQM